MEHYRYQGPLLEAVPPIHAGTDRPDETERLECIRKVEQADPSVRDALMALMFIYKRKDPLSDGFRLTNPHELDHAQFTVESMVDRLDTCHRLTVQNMLNLAYALDVLHYLTWKFRSFGTYTQEVPLGFLDLLELEAKGGDHLDSYATWMLKKGFECVISFTVQGCPTHSSSQRQLQLPPSSRSSRACRRGVWRIWASRQYSSERGCRKASESWVPRT